MLCSERILLLPRSDLLHPPRKLRSISLHGLLLYSSSPPSDDPSSHGFRSSSISTKCSPALLLEHLPASPCQNLHPLPFVTQPPFDSENGDLHPRPRAMASTSLSTKAETEEVRFHEDDESRESGHYHAFEVSMELDAASYGDRRIVTEWPMPATVEKIGLEDEQVPSCSIHEQDEVLASESHATMSANVQEAGGYGEVSYTGIVEETRIWSGAENLTGSANYHQPVHDSNNWACSLFQLNGASHHQKMQEHHSYSDMSQDQGKAITDPTTKPATAPSMPSCNGNDDAMMMIRMPTYRTPFSRVSETMMFLESLGADCSRIFREDPTPASGTDREVQELRQLVSALEGYGLKWTELGRIFNLCPRILHLNPVALQTVATFFFDEVGLRRRDFSKIIKRCPRLLTSNIDQQLRPALEFLLSLGFRNMGQVVSNNATLLSFSVENKIIPKLHYLESLGFSQNDVASIAIRFPAIFNYSAKENLQPKYEYLVNVMGRRNRDLLSFPQYFGYSLERKIRPRYECIARMGASLSLQAMLKISDAEFTAKFQCMNNVTYRRSIDASLPLAENMKLSGLHSFCNAGMSKHSSVNGSRDHSPLLEIVSHLGT